MRIRAVRPANFTSVYSTNPKALQPEDLEYTIAVADQMAVALRNLKERNRSPAA